MANISNGARSHNEFINYHPNDPEFHLSQSVNSRNNPFDPCAYTSPNPRRNKKPCYFCKEARVQCVLMPNDDSGRCYRCETKRIPAKMCTVRVPLDQIVRVYIEEKRKDDVSCPMRGRSSDSLDASPRNATPVLQEPSLNRLPSLAPHTDITVNPTVYMPQDFPGFFDYTGHHDMPSVYDPMPTTVNVQGMVSSSLGINWDSVYDIFRENHLLDMPYTYTSRF